ncbi:hypothetical protein PanWU01x14_165570, partial [Parasponia andersonii]
LDTCIVGYQYFVFFCYTYTLELLYDSTYKIIQQYSLLQTLRIFSFLQSSPSSTIVTIHILSWYQSFLRSDVATENDSYSSTSAPQISYPTTQITTSQILPGSASFAINFKLCQI